MAVSMSGNLEFSFSSISWFLSRMWLSPKPPLVSLLCSPANNRTGTGLLPSMITPNKDSYLLNLLSGKRTGADTVENLLIIGRPVLARAS